jgi:hypothetical protein
VVRRPVGRDAAIGLHCKTLIPPINRSDRSILRYRWSRCDSYSRKARHQGSYPHQPKHESSLFSSSRPRSRRFETVFSTRGVVTDDFYPGQYVLPRMRRRRSPVMRVLSAGRISQVFGNIRKAVPPMTFRWEAETRSQIFKFFTSPVIFRKGSGVTSTIRSATWRGDFSTSADW